MAKEKQKRRQIQAPLPKRKPGAPIDRPHISRTNPLADMLFGSITPEMVAAASQGEEWPTERSERSARSDGPEKFSTTPAESAAPRTRGFLALPHALLDRVFAEIRHYSGFKVYLFLYREAFRRVHDERLSTRCEIPLRLLSRQCGMPERVVRDALKVLARDRWIEIENRPGISSFYVVYRPVGAADSAAPTPADSAAPLKNDPPKKDDDKEIRSSSKKGGSSVEKHRRPDDDSLSIIKEAYEKLTGNSWTSKDTEAYATLPKSLKAEDVIRYIRVIHERTTKPVGSFAYFVKAIFREQQSPKTRKTTINQLHKIIESVRARDVGGPVRSTTDFLEDVKTAAARAGIAYSPDLLAEALSKAGVRA